MNFDDVAMFERGQDACLAPESFNECALVQFGQQQLERDQTREAGVFGEVDDAHAAGADDVDQTIATEVATQQGACVVDPDRPAAMCAA